MSTVVVVYDNLCTPCDDINRVVGKARFADIILRQSSVRDRFMEMLKSLSFVSSVHELNEAQDFDSLIVKLKMQDESCCVIHIFSHVVMLDVEQSERVLSKSLYLKNNLAVTLSQAPIIYMMRGTASYIDFFRGNITQTSVFDVYGHKQNFDIFEAGSECFCDISKYDSFMDFLSGEYDSRYFNSLEGVGYTITKKSSNVDKLKAEYTYYHLLPDTMKMWYVMPFSYQESTDGASYTMERHHMTDLALRWVHGSIELKEFAQIMERLFYYINARAERSVSKSSYRESADFLYIDKVRSRVEHLKQSKQFVKLASYIENGTEYSSIDKIIGLYEKLYQECMKNHKPVPTSVIGHGDLCFSNILYSKETGAMKFIDPKGAMNEVEMYTDPYYDIAKLSHSICGSYDFINYSLHRIYLDSNMQFALDAGFDNAAYVEIFREFCASSGFDFTLVRLQEASLFLSMLPLHIDYPYKVLGFILNAINILKEVQK